MKSKSLRYEVKMTCSEIHLPDARAWINLHPDLFSEAYPPRQVNSLYFDTRDLDCLNDNLIGTGQRKKLRLRWYGAGYDAVQGTLELKCKSNQPKTEPQKIYTHGTCILCTAWRC